jgi:hypothetical protein
MSLVRNGLGDRGRKQRWLCRGTTGDRSICYSTTNPDLPAPRRQNHTLEDAKPKVFRRKLERSVFVITAAQNATPVHEGFVRSLRQYCDHRSAELLVIPLRYKNPTSRWSKSQENDEVWAPEITPYLYNVRKALNKNLVVLGDIKTQPTAVNPLTGYEAFTHGESGILGHTKLALKTIPTPQGKLPKILTTTGACTVPNFTDSKAGKMGEFHHTLGALVIEIVGNIFHMRQLGATSDGSFYDLEDHYGDEKPERGLRPFGLVMGDTHVNAISPAVRDATFGSMIPALEPLNLVWHDLVEGISINHHTTRNPFVDTARQIQRLGDVRDECERAIHFVKRMTPRGVTSHIVPSNHNDWLHRWILDTDWKHLEAKNRSFYLHIAALLQEAAAGMEVDDAERLDAFTLFAKRHLGGPHGGKDIRVLSYDESLMLGKIECGMHGHLGPNGARGTLKNLRRIGVKSVTGHEHSPGIDEGAWRVGTSTELSRGYNRGPSSWLNTHCLIYPNSKRTLINIINGEWRA